MTDNIWRVLPFKFTEIKEHLEDYDHKKGELNPELADSVKTMN